MFKNTFKIMFGVGLIALILLEPNQRRQTVASAASQTLHIVAATLDQAADWIQPESSTVPVATQSTVVSSSVTP